MREHSQGERIETVQMGSVCILNLMAVRDLHGGVFFIRRFVQFSQANSSRQKKFPLCTVFLTELQKRNHRAFNIVFLRSTVLFSRLSFDRLFSGIFFFVSGVSNPCAV